MISLYLSYTLPPSTWQIIRKMPHYTKVSSDNLLPFSWRNVFGTRKFYFKARCFTMVKIQILIFWYYKTHVSEVVRIQYYAKKWQWQVSLKHSNHLQGYIPRKPLTSFRIIPVRGPTKTDKIYKLA
jgi:hypothetical protein